MTASLLPNGKQQYFDSNGAPAAGYLLYTYIAGTTIQKDTYTTEAAGVANANPVELDVRGEATIFWDGVYKVDLKTPGGVSVTGYPIDNISSLARKQDVTAITTNLAASTGSSLVGHIATGAGAVATTVQAKLRQVVNAKDFGASSSNTNAQNKTALQAAISAVDLAGGGLVVIDWDCNYGLVVGTASTWPSFSGMTNDIVIIDRSKETVGYAAGTKGGAMDRVWTNTIQTATPGQHNGNTTWFRGAWHRSIIISNDANLAAVGDPSRLATDNRRASYFFANDGVVTWGWQQGGVSGAGYTNDELSHMCLVAFGAFGGGTYSDGRKVLIVNRQTGNWGINTDPDAGFHFKAQVTGYDAAIFESLTTECTMRLRNSDGSGDDVLIRNSDGSFRVVVDGSQQIEMTKSNRYLGIGLTPSYKFDVTDSRASNFVCRLTNTSATNGYILSLISNSAAGTGFNLIEARTDSGSDLKFKVRGDGEVTCDGSFTGGGADRAEAMEWEDGNPGKQDRRGYAVVVVPNTGGKIRIATPADALSSIIGVVSANPDSVGNAAPHNWANKYLRDEFGAIVVEDVKVMSKSGEITVKRQKVNPAFDASKVYVPRLERKEWDAVGLLGIVAVRKGQPTKPHWLNFGEISPNVERWMVMP